MADSATLPSFWLSRPRPRTWPKSGSSWPNSLAITVVDGACASTSNAPSRAGVAPGRTVALPPVATRATPSTRRVSSRASSMRSSSRLPISRNCPSALPRSGRSRRPSPASGWRARFDGQATFDREVDAGRACGTGGKGTDAALRLKRECVRFAQRDLQILEPITFGCAPEPAARLDRSEFLNLKMEQGKQWRALVDLRAERELGRDLQRALRRERTDQPLSIEREPAELARFARSAR